MQTKEQNCNKFAWQV